MALIYQSAYPRLFYACSQLAHSHGWPLATTAYQVPAGDLATAEATLTELHGRSFMGYGQAISALELLINGDDGDRHALADHYRSLSYGIAEAARLLDGYCERAQLVPTP